MIGDYSYAGAFLIIMYGASLGFFVGRLWRTPGNSFIVMLLDTVFGIVGFYCGASIAFHASFALIDYFLLLASAGSITLVVLFRLVLLLFKRLCRKGPPEIGAAS